MSRIQPDAWERFRWQKHVTRIISASPLSFSEFGFKIGLPQIRQQLSSTYRETNISPNAKPEPKPAPHEIR